MEYKELLEKYQALLSENICLKEEIKALKELMGIAEPPTIADGSHEYKSNQGTPELPSSICNKSDSMEKISCLCRSLKDGTMYSPKGGKTKGRGHSGIRRSV